MKYRLPRQVTNQELDKIISNEVRKQKLNLLRLSRKQLKEISSVCKAIVKQGLTSNFLCRKLPDGLGFGIFLHPDAQPIKKGQVIAPYSGEVYFAPQNFSAESSYAFEPLSRVIFTKEEHLYFDPERRYHPRRLYSLYVDGCKKGNFTRFINHSETPNIVADLFRISANSYGLDPSAIEVIYLAKKTIRPGEQLLVSYEGDGPSYWGVLGIKPVPITPQTFQLNASLKVIRSSKSDKSKR